jgi:type II secretory pathway component PulK
MRRRPPARDGFALAAVLWVLTVGAVLAAGTALVGRQAFAAARNRVNQERAYWTAEGCLAELRSLADAALASANPSKVTEAWSHLDRDMDSLPLPVPLRCQVSFVAVGSGIYVNASNDILLRKFFRRATDVQTGDALTDALLDWRDPDDEQRADGAERRWYDAKRQQAPRNDSIASVEELTLVRGFADHVDLLPYLTVVPSRISLTTAPAPVLAALPGFVDETVVRLIADRSKGTFFNNLSALQAELSATASESLQVHLPELAAVTSADPDAWIVTVRAESGSPAVAATSEVRLDRLANRTIIVRRRTR